MVFSRSFKLLNNVVSPARSLNQVRNSGDHAWVYRRLGVEETVPKENYLLRDFLGGLTVWWILWKCYHEPGHILGEYEYPDPSKWTDAELGIPPDDEE